MLATDCPNCGRPAPLHLGSTAIDCPACRARSPIPASVAARLAAAAHVLRSVAERGRQLGARTRWLLSSAWIRVAFFGIVLLVLLIPFGCLFAIGLDIAGTSGWELKDLSFVLSCGGPLVLMGLAGALGILGVHRRAQRLREMCAAVPPSAPGEPAACYVCGGPVAQQGTDPIARCGYCRADNVVTPRDMAHAHARRALTLDQFEAQLRTASAAARTGMRRLLLSIIGFAAVAPMLGTCGGCCISYAILSIDTEPHLEIEHTWIDGPDPSSRCLAIVTSRTPEYGWLKTPDYEHPGGSHSQQVDAAGLETFRIDALVGMVLARREPDGRYTVGRVEGVHGELDGGNKVVLLTYQSYGTLELEVMPHVGLCVPPPGATFTNELPPGYP